MKNYGKASVITTALLVPIALVISSALEWYLKSSNPDNVNIAGDLAYLREILITGLVVGVILALISLTTAILGLLKDTDKSLSKIAITLLFTIVILATAAAIFNNQSSAIEKTYREEQLLR